jgi:hypothetical protein
MKDNRKKCKYRKGVTCECPSHSQCSCIYYMSKQLETPHLDGHVRRIDAESK